MKKGFTILFLLLFSLSTLSACGKSDEEKAQEKLKNAFIAEGGEDAYNELSSALKSEYKADMNSPTTTESQKETLPVTLDELLEVVGEFSIWNVKRYDTETNSIQHIIGDADFKYLAPLDQEWYLTTSVPLDAEIQLKDLNLRLCILFSGGDRVKRPDGEPQKVGKYEVYRTFTYDDYGNQCIITIYNTEIEPHMYGEYAVVLNINANYIDSKGRKLDEGVFDEFVDAEYNFISEQLEQF